MTIRSFSFHPGRSHAARLVLLVVLYTATAKLALARNLLSSEWRTQKAAAVMSLDSPVETTNWPTINVGISWERQGYFVELGEFFFVQNVTIPETGAGASRVPYDFVVNLQCSVHEVYLDGQKLAENLRFQGKAPRAIQIPADKLTAGIPHQLALRVSGFQWTGGMIKNQLTLSHPSFGSDDELELTAATSDHVFGSNQALNFTVEYKLSDQQAGDIAVRIVSDFGQNLYTATIAAPPDKNTQVITPDRTLFAPGIYHLIANTTGTYFSQTDLWFAVEPDQISCAKTSQPEILSWWDNTITELNKIPPQFKVTKKDENEKKVAYLVEMISWDSVKVYAWLVVPKAPGIYPAILHVPGYGMGYLTPNQWLKNSNNAVEMALCIRGHGLSKETINPGFKVLNGYVGWKISDPNTYIYRGAYMDCLRAIDFLRTRPEVDPARIGVLGGSQGGALSFATAALAGKKIRACVAICPYGGDLEHLALTRPVFNQELDAYAQKWGCSRADVDATLRRVDLKYLAGRITAPVFMTTGLYDDDCTSHIAFATFNEIKSPKQYIVYPTFGHIAPPANEAGLAFLRKELGF